MIFHRMLPKASIHLKWNESSVLYSTSVNCLFKSFNDFCENLHKRKNFPTTHPLQTPFHQKKVILLCVAHTLSKRKAASLREGVPNPTTEPYSIQIH